MNHLKPLLTLGVAGMLLVNACTGVSTPVAKGGSTMIPQPPVEGIQVAPLAERVDLAVPTFTNPTKVTNPLFPVSRQESVLMLGRVDGKPFRTEVTLLPFTRIIELEGQRIEALISQYVAYLDGRIQEVAYDHDAQADDGSVWYLGEDVFDFRNGAIVTTEGTWIAGKDGPAAMIMPAHPKVGDTYRTENAPGLVFEEVTVESVDRTLDGPLGPIEGGMVARELHMDGATEDKQFAPGYGEFYTADGPDVEALALAVPTDSATGPLPADLVTLEAGAGSALDAAESQDWKTASSVVHRMSAAWDAYRTGGVPKLIEPRITDALRSLAGAADARDPARARQAAIDAAQSSLDLQLRYRPAAEVDLARLDLWISQLLLDAANHDAGAVNGDVFTLDYIRDRILALSRRSEATRINTQLGELQIAVVDADLDAATEAARRLRTSVAGIRAAA